MLPSRHISPIAAIGVENRQVCRQNLETTTREIEMNSQWKNIFFRFSPLTNNENQMSPIYKANFYHKMFYIYIYKGNLMEN